MDVHHHSHTPRKRWSHYFWEFLMLFLAVFCGFLAEYQLEHKIEKDRARELAVSFYEELKNDSTEMQRVMQNRLKKDSAIMYLYDYFQDSNIFNLPKVFGYNFAMAFMVNSPIIFEPREAILEQLKSSGSLRYFKNQELQKLTGEISVAIANLKARHELEAGFSRERVSHIFDRHNDHQWLKRIRGNGQQRLIKNLENYKNDSLNIPFHLGNPEQFNKNETMNMLQMLLLTIQTTRINQYDIYAEKNQMLLEELRKQYDLK